MTEYSTNEYGDIIGTGASDPFQEMGGSLEPWDDYGNVSQAGILPSGPISFPIIRPPSFPKQVSPGQAVTDPADLEVNLGAFPGIGGVAAAAVTGAGFLLTKGIFKAGTKLSLGFLKTLWARFGPIAVKTAIGAAAFKELTDMIFGGASDDATITVRGKSKRYSIGKNPRVNTLLKVAKRVDNIFTSYDKRISKFRSRLRGGTRTRTRVMPYNPYLSPVETKALRRGR